MWHFLLDITRNFPGRYTVVIFEEDSTAASREYTVEPQKLRWTLLAAALLVFVFAGTIGVFSPLSNWIRGNDIEELRRSARMNAMRAAALEDSLAVQQEYAQHLGALITGRIDSSTQALLLERGILRDSAGDEQAPARDVRSVHEQPAVQIDRISVSGSRRDGRAEAVSGLSGPNWPAEPPVEGFVTQGFRVENGHYAVDIAVEEGTRVRAVASGYVVFADWTQEAGQVIAVQHSGGYLSVYKHNSQLLKHVGDRVTYREPVAVSGNTGHITTGPHVHFELWHEGLAQDPRQFIIGW